MDTSKPGGWIRDRLVEDLKLAIEDAEDLLRSTRQKIDEGYRSARAGLESKIDDARNSLSTLEQRVAEGSREAIADADQYIREHPWQSVGVGALVGLVAGLLLSRR